jgi:hypothetical protein
MSTLPYALRRVYADGDEQPISDHATFGDGWSAGQRAVHQDRENAYALYRGQHRLARFGSSRLMSRVDAQHLPAVFGAVS